MLQWKTTMLLLSVVTLCQWTSDLLGDDLGNVSPGKAEMIRILLHFKAKTKMKEMQWDFATILTGSNIQAYYIFLRLGLGEEDSLKWGWREVFSDENASDIESSKSQFKHKSSTVFFVRVFWVK